MDKFDKLQRLHRIFLSRKRPIKIRELADKLECTEKTVRRAIEELQLYFQAPLEYSEEHKGWHYLPGHNFELPGLWLTPDELQSLILLLHILENFGNGLLNQELTVVEKTIHRLLEARGIKPAGLLQRVKAIPIAHKTIANDTFIKIGEALLQRQLLHIHYIDRDNKPSQRTLSPQQLVYYRENWYLDAWCHLRQDLRIFSLPRINRIDLHTNNGENRALDIPPEQLHQHFASSYGLFTGEPKHTATLRFLAPIAREIATQQWHPAQTYQWDNQDYILSIPYSDHRELVGDILRHMPNVIVEGPPELKSNLIQKLQQGLQQHE
jgi:predicted DNA-binding transcriptional regulator YafY